MSIETLEKVYPVPRERLIMRRDSYGVVAMVYPFGGTLRILHPSEAVIIALCDGTRTIGDIIDIVSRIFNIDRTRSRNYVEHIFNTYNEYFQFSNLPLESTVSYDPMDFVYSPKSFKNFRHYLESPLGITYVCTKVCHLRCKYCYANSVHISDSMNSSIDSPLSLEILEKIVRDFKENGIKFALFSGGEPLLLKDIHKRVELFTRNDIRVFISTKYPVSRKKSEQLKKAGIKEIQVSLDSFIPDIEDELVGVPGMFYKLIRSIENLIEAGIEVWVNTVLTSKNIYEFPKFVRFLNKLGVKRVTPSLYTVPIGWASRYASELLPSSEQLSWLSRELKQINPTREESINVDYFTQSNGISLDKQVQTMSSFQRQLCGGGRVGLVMLPDGRVTVCERLANLDWLIVGDLKKESVRDVWESERVRWFRNLPRELYRGTPCYSCQYFETICQPRGICLLSSYALNGRFFGPDSMCPFVRRGRKNESKG
ncbi:hypothetical protein A0127_06435 [Thermococcus peptonophilus]|uniref:Radical SAM core domain-containing protein n=2 Tax=Thermococcus peptonophilus TaxID=53952 RepID=A0A142CVN4_9EURY|nr:hypothetical protein A0127_06435 [Thermococcus peptonophilus]